MSTLSWKQLKLARRGQGLCPNCGQVPEDGRVYCRACRERMAEYLRRYRASHSSAPSPPQPRPRHRVVLPERVVEFARRLHLGHQAIRSGRARATVAELVEGALNSMHLEALGREVDVAHRERQRRLRAARAAARRCIYCGAPASPGLATCEECRLARREKLRRYRRRTA